MLVHVAVNGFSGFFVPKWLDCLICSSRVYSLIHIGVMFARTREVALDGVFGSIHGCSGFGSSWNNWYYGMLRLM
jgi:hypothetical protein